jgi:hypothetical protein
MRIVKRATGESSQIMSQSKRPRGRRCSETQSEMWKKGRKEERKKGRKTRTRSILKGQGKYHYQERASRSK